MMYRLKFPTAIFTELLLNTLTYVLGYDFTYSKNANHVIVDMTSSQVKSTLDYLKRTKKLYQNDLLRAGDANLDNSKLQKKLAEVELTLENFKRTLAEANTTALYVIKFPPGAVQGMLSDALQMIMGTNTAQYKYDSTGSTVEFSPAQLKETINYLKSNKSFAEEEPEENAEIITELDNALNLLRSAVMNSQNIAQANLVADCDTIKINSSNSKQLLNLAEQYCVRASLLDNK